MDKNNIDIPIWISASYATGPNYLNNEFHSHNAYEIFVMIESEADYYIENSVYHLKRGDVLIINDKEKHKFPNQGNMNFSRLTIAFNPDIFKDLSTPRTNLLHCFCNHEPGKDNIIHLNNMELNELLTIADKVMQLYNQEEYGSDILTISQMLKLLTILNQKYMLIKPQLSDTAPLAVKPLLEYIDNNLDKECSLESISKELKIHKSHINRVMKEYTGYTVHKYINIRRVTSAKALLIQGYSATDACYMVGFNDYTSFTRVFKSITGFTPRDYKKIWC